MKKGIIKVFMLLMCAVMGVFGMGLTACGGKDTNTVRVWAAQRDQDMIKGLIDKFVEQNPELCEGKTFNVSVNGEDEAATEVLKDIDAAADVFAFSDDQIGNLVARDALYNLTNAPSTVDVIARNTEESITATKSGSSIYAYPSSAEGIFVYYDKTVFTTEDVKTIETMKTKAGAKGYNYAFGVDIKNGYFCSMFWLGMGCQVFGADGKDNTTVTLNNTGGQTAAKYISPAGAGNSAVANIAATQIVPSFSNKTIAAYVSGAWEHQTFVDLLGDNLGIVKLPTAKINGIAATQLKGFRGHKLYGVKANTAHSEIAIKLADFLTNKESQITRVNTRYFLPTNKEVLADAQLMNKDILKVEKQATTNTYSCPKPSTDKANGYWDLIGNLAFSLYSGDVATNDIKAKLDTLVNEIMA